MTNGFNGIIARIAEMDRLFDIASELYELRLKYSAISIQIRDLVAEQNKIYAQREVSLAATKKECDQNGRKESN